MKNKISAPICLMVITVLLFSCSAKNISTGFYYQNKKVLDAIQTSYKALYKEKPFTIAFTDKLFRTVSLEIITDTLTYIYEFEINEKRLSDTLYKYKIDAAATSRLIGLMASIHCTWINNFDYYVDEKKQSLIFISIKPVASHSHFSEKKYYILTYYSQPQHFDSEGRLLDKRKLRRLRKINGEIFRRINDKVCYTISSEFR